ncbi:TonB-dependent receptor [Neolewinella litorea]|uniref:TonB-dependent receptor n=1 Tax=Neolewinella litorea TaxID=2562452 RepID=A0A4S4NQV9_9BACT|nr:TonB-dependent receptor [Neolewinella litorea]THH41555.1 TonB-dependent receptor [Neolewinella litorea]
MTWPRCSFAVFLAVCVPFLLFAQTDSLSQRYTLAAGEKLLEDALIALTEAGAELSYRPDQLPDIVVQVPADSYTVAGWLDLLLRDTELTYVRGAAGYLILLDRELTDQRFTLFGMVSDGQSGERLIGATVQLLDEQLGTYTNEYGFYTIATPGGRRRLRVTYIGYRPLETELILRSDSLLNLNLQPNRELPQVIVTSTHGREGEARYFETGTRIGRAEVDQLGGPGGEDDPLQLARLLPGVTSGADGIGGILIRGSEAGHNLILLDGVPVYGLSHAGGLFSIFSNQAIRRIDLYKDALPARFGGRIGGVLDVHTRDGNQYENELTVGSSLLSAQLAAEGPIRTGESSFLLTGRYFWASSLLRQYSEVYKEKRGRKGSTDYDVYDVNLKLNQKAGDRGRIYFSLYSGVDDYHNNSWQSRTLVPPSDAGTVFVYNTPTFRSERVRWGNTVGALRYNHVFSDRTFGNFRLSYSDLQTQSAFERYDSILEVTNHIFEGQLFSGRYYSQIRQLGAAFDGQHGMGHATTLRFGLEANAHRFLPQLMTGESRLTSFPTLDAADIHRPVEFNNYLSYESKWRRLYYRLGLRGSYWRNGGVDYVNLSPRLLLAGPLSESLDWQLSYDRTVQPVHLLNSFVIGLPSDLWVPSAAGIAPASSPRFSGKLVWSPKSEWTLTSSLYYKRMRGLIAYSEGRQSSLTWMENLSRGSGEAYGWEMVAQRSRGRFRGWMSYTLARSDRTFDRSINQGMTFPFRYDRRHAVNLLLIYQLGERTTLTGSWRFETGLAYSLSLATRTNPTDDGPENIPVVLERNGFRMPPNHRFDVNLHTTLSGPDSRVTHSIDVGLYNVYNRHNPVYYEIRPEYSVGEEGLVSREQFYKIFVAPVLPSLSYQVTIGKPVRPEFGK